MSLRFRSFLPFIIPGTIAFVSWWLYTSFKKNEDTGLDEQEEADKGCLSISDPQGLTGQDRPEAIEQRPAEQDVVLQVHAPAAKSSVGEPLSSPVVMVASGKLVTPFHSKAATDSLLNGPENARLVTQVLSAAAQEVMAVSSCVVSEVASSSTPTFNGEETMREEDHESPLPSLQSQANHLEQRVAQITEEVVNGCLTPSAWEKSEDEQQCTLAAQAQLELTPVLPELQAEEAPTGTDDSGCGTRPSEDDISSGDLLLSTDLSLAIPENKEDLIQISGISRASEEKEDGLQDSSDLTRLQEPMLTAEHMAAVCHAGTTSSMNGSSETEANQSGGSAVNSVDSGDSCSTLGTGDGQQSGNQTCQSQRSELIVWEIEVPEHLVGQLTGRKGRHVSFLKKSSGAKIYISTLPYAEEFKICHIEGTQQQVDKALALIGKKFKDLDLTNLYAPPPQQPKPEGGVVDDVLTVPFAENVQEDSVKDCLSTTDDLPPTTLTSVDQCAQAVSQLSFVAESLKRSVSFPLSASTPVPDASTEAQHHENEDLGEPAKTSDSMEELHRLPARLVTQVLSAAAQEVMAVSSCVVSAVASSSTPTFNGEETMREEDHESPLPPLQSQANHLEQRVAQITEEVVNGCLTPSAWEKSEDEQQCTLAAQTQLELTPALPELQAEEAATGTDDSGCGTHLSEDDISSGDLPLSTDLSLAIPENKEDLIQISGISRASEEKEDGLQESSDLTRLQETMLTAQHMAALCHAGTTSSMNGSSETEADQSGGSAVNSVDSGDSCSTLGTGNGQQSGNQTSQSQRSELIVWEIEVPEHLVGILTGRKGRHVSFLKKSSGAKIYISTLPYAEEFKICHIEGTQQQVDKALALIGKKFKDLDMTNLYAPPPQRPKPEGGVVDDVLTVPFAENVQEDSVTDSLSTKDDLPPTTLTSVDQCAQAVSQLSFIAESLKGSVSFPLSASTPVPDASTEAQHHENGDLGEPAKTSDSMEELHRLPARLVTQVISAAAQEVMAVSSCVVSAVASSSTPTFNGEETMREEDHESPLPPLQSQANHLEQRVAQITEEVVNGCLTPSAWEKSEDEQQCTLAAQAQLELTPVLPELQAGEATTGTDDSGCGTRLSEDDISSGDLLLSTDLSLAIPENKEDLIQISGISRASEEKEDGLQDSSDLTRLQEPMLTAQYMAALCHAGTTSSMNGSNETEADQSGGSAVNSVDSGDSCSTLGTGDGQQSGNQTSQSQRSELIVWEIEVPEHLVGQLTGRKGRHVSFLKKSSGAKIYISTLPYAEEFKICHIEGTQQQVDKALALIGKKFKDLDLTNLYAPPPQRPKPEGGVVDDVLTVPFAENVQEDSVKDSLSTTDDLPPTTLTSVDQCAQAVSQLSFVAESLKGSVSFPLSASTPVPDASTEAQHHENEDLGEPAKSSDSMEELHRLPARLVTQVLSAAAQEVMAVSSCVVSAVASSSTPTFNGEETMREEDHESPLPPLQSQANHLEQRVAQITEEVVNGCLTPSVREKSEDEQQCTLAAQTQLELTPALPELQAEEAATGTDDSGCGTRLSEDDISSGDLPLSTDLSLAIPENKEDLIQISGISRASEEKEDGLQESSDLTRLQEPMLTAQYMAALCHAGTTSSMNGSSETEADQSGGSAVNSVDSGDSCSTLGTGNGQRSGNQTSQSQRSELIVWEIEVPNHLVGRLIGQQGRHVSFLKKSSGAKIYISTLPYTDESEICHIEGTQQQVDKALALIGKKFKDLDLTNLYAPPLPLSLPRSLPMLPWLLLPYGVTVEVIGVNIVSAGHMFVQQHTHPTFHALRSLDQQMFLCYSQSDTPALPSPAEVGVICAAPAVGGAWWRAQVISFYKDSNEVEIQYVDYGGYNRVKIDTLRQIRSDFVTLPFQGTEVLLDNIAPLPGEDWFSTEATHALEEMTLGVPLLAQVTNYDKYTGLPVVQMWNMVGDDDFIRKKNLILGHFRPSSAFSRVLIGLPSDFVTLPFQGTEVLLDNIAPLPGEDRFSTEATHALEEMTQGVPLLTQVTNYDNDTGLLLVEMWNFLGDDVLEHPLILLDQDGRGRVSPLDLTRLVVVGRKEGNIKTSAQQLKEKSL